MTDVLPDMIIAAYTLYYEEQLITINIVSCYGSQTIVDAIVPSASGGHMHALLVKFVRIFLLPFLYSSLQLRP
jgi:hypothetical protein